MKPSPYLIARRKAAHVLNFISQEDRHLGAKGVKFIAVHIDQWDYRGDNIILALRGRHLIAEVEIQEGSGCWVTIPSWYDMVRTTHLSAFKPEEHGMIINTSYNPITLEKYPDSEGYIDCRPPKDLHIPAEEIRTKTRYSVPQVIM